MGKVSTMLRMKKRTARIKVNGDDDDDNNDYNNRNNNNNNDDAGEWIMITFIVRVKRGNHYRNILVHDNMYTIRLPILYRFSGSMKFRR